MATKTQDLATTDSLSYAIMRTDPAEAASYLRELTDGQRLTPQSLDIIKLPAGGATLWMVPDARQGERAEKAIEGIVLYQRPARAFWSTPYGAGGASTPPDCYSNDGQVGIGSPGVECVSCEHAQFGTKIRPDGSQGRGQACTLNRLLFLAQPKSILPMIVRVSPASLEPVKKFFLRLGSEGTRPDEIVVRLELERVNNADNVAYARMKPSFVRDLEPVEIDRVKAALLELRPLFASVQVDVSDD